MLTAATVFFAVKVFERDTHKDTNNDEVSARLTSFGSPESQVRMQVCEFPIGSR
jgi:hypothetical protein